MYIQQLPKYVINTVESVKRDKIYIQNAMGPAKYCVGGFLPNATTLTISTTKDTGKQGSLRWALEQNYPRSINFDIKEEEYPHETKYIFKFNNDAKLSSFLTLDGRNQSHNNKKNIEIRNASLKGSEVNDIYISYITIRPTNELSGDRKKPPNDALSFNHSCYIYKEHISCGLSSDEVNSTSFSQFVTDIYNFVAWPLSNKNKKIAHAYGALQNGNNILYARNIFFSYQMRGTQMESIESSDGEKSHLYYCNNINSYFTESGTRIKSSGKSKFHLYGNSYINPKSLKSLNCIEYAKFKDSGDNGLENSKNNKSKVLIYDCSYNHFPLDESNISLNDMPTRFKSKNLPDYEILENKKSFTDVLQNCGNTFPKRDKIDTHAADLISNNNGFLIYSHKDLPYWDH